MSSKIRTSLLSLAVIAVLLFSAIGPTIVYADDGAPPDTSTADTTGGSDLSECSSDEDAEDSGDSECSSNEDAEDSGGNEGGSDGEATDTGEGESSDADPAAELPDTSDSESAPDGAATDATGGSDSAAGADAPQPAEDAAPVVEEAAPPADPNLLAELPDNTSVTVLNADGQSEPLATQDAANAIASTTDPIWCPLGQPPIPDQNGCTPPFTSFADLLNHLSGNAGFQGAGTIFVEQGVYGGGESSIDFNTYNLSNISSSDLIVQGGWNPGTNTVDPASTSNFTGVEFIIGSSTNPWGGSLTINNLVLNDPNQTGLTLYAQNDINISNVTVENSTTGGGAHLNANGNVSINNSKFLRNNTAGATINAGGDVAIANSEFSNPFNQRRQIKGLDITSTRTVSLFQVLVVGNRRVGADITAGGRVSIAGSDDTHRSVFSETNGLNSGVFYGYGLRVVTPDAIDLSFVTANNNFLWGADLDAGGDVNISDSFFNANSTSSPTFIDDTGLLVTSKGAVTLNRVEASGNRLIGAVIDAVGPVNIDSSIFSDNLGVITTGTGTTYHGLGLGVVSSSGISLSGVIASGNGLTGASLDTSSSLTGGGITITNSIFSNNTTGSATALLGNGLLVVGAGNVVLFEVTMDGNQVNGGTIQTVANTTLDSVTATNNGTDGVQVEAICTHLNSGTYSGNGQYGLNLTTSALDLAVMPTFGGNTGGDIFPANPVTCAPALLSPTPGTNPGSVVTSLGSSVSTNTSNLQQAVSFIPNTGNGASGTSLLGLSLNSIFTGITRDVTADAMVTSIFVGNYIYVYTIYNADTDPSLDNLQIIFLTPAPRTQVAKVGS